MTVPRNLVLKPKAQANGYLVMISLITFGRA